MKTEPSTDILWLLSMELNSSEAIKSCPECLKTTKGETTHCFHSGAVMSTVGMGPKLVIGFEMYKPGQDSVLKDEGELNVAKRLISSVAKSHRNLNGCVVYDALGCRLLVNGFCVRKFIITGRHSFNWNEVL